MSRFSKPVIFVLAAIYVAIDGIFMILARPIAKWLAERAIFASLRRWIVSLSPYPTLALFAVPLVVLEPVKPLAAYLVATGHVASGAAVLVVGELLKLVIVERLFCVCRGKLMSIPLFAAVYSKYRRLMDWLESTEVWQGMRRAGRVIQLSVRSYVVQFKASHEKPRRISMQSR